MNSLHGVGGVTPPRQSSSTRSSSAHLLNGQGIQGVGRSPLSSTEDVFAELPPVTAASVASDHFKTELNLHDNDAEGRPADTIVILHDSCYGHRFSRPRTSKAGLSTIVERPERIHASILGLSVAYVRLGERYAEGKYPLHPQRDASNIPSIPFRIRKTTRKMSLSSPAVTNVHGVKWMEELKIMCDTAEAKLAMNGKELTRPEMTRSPDQEVQKFHEGDLYLCSESLNAMEGALGAVCEGVDAVFNGTASGTGPQRAFVAIRPPGHHCSASHPSGFCWVNNVHVGIAHASLNHGLTHAAMIDFDLHHGDGSQAMAWAQNARATGLPKNAASWKKTSIGYFSLHDINSYPCEMGDEEKVKNASLCIENAHGQNIWNVHLQSWKSEAEFWELYETKYSVLLEKTRLFLKAQTARLRAIPNGPKPKAAIFLSAGFDASEWESSGMQRHSVNVPTEFYARLTRDVVKLAAEDGCGVEGRVVSVLEGGYSDRALASGVLSHISGLAGGDPVPVKREDSYNGLGWEMSQKARAITGEEGEILNKSSLDQLHEYDSDWWALRNLQALEAVVNPTDAPAPEPKKPRDLIPPTYSSPTQSFSAKIVATPNFKRSTSNMSNISGTPPRQVVRPPTPPPPDVDWATAAHELSKLLIPTDRQTMSCKPEDLSAEATRARRDRQSILMPPTQANGAPVEAQVVSTRMALRGRKAKLSTPEEEENIVERPVSRVNRRKTVAGTAISAVEKVWFSLASWI
jgi:histone deacetylase HOS3